MLPTQRDGHVNLLLTDYAVLYRQGDADFAADRIAPGVGVPEMTGSYPIYTKDYFSRDALKERGPGGDAVDVGYGKDTGSFTCKVWGARKPQDDQTRANERDIASIDRVDTMFLSGLAKIKREKTLKAVAFTTGVWGLDVPGDAAPGAGEVLHWSDADSTPLNDIATYKSVGKKTINGLELNCLAIGYEVWEALKNNPQIVARVLGVGSSAAPSKVTRQAVAELMELEELIVCGAVENTAIEKAPGTASYTGGYVIGKEALLFHRNMAQTKEAITALRTFNWEGLTGNAAGTRVLTYDKPPHVRYHEIEEAYEQKVVAADAGIYFPTLIA